MNDTNEPKDNASVEPIAHFPTADELLTGNEPREEVLVKFPNGQQFLLKRLEDITDLREVGEQAAMLQKVQLEDDAGNKFNPDELLAYRIALLSASLVNPVLTPKKLLEIGRKRGPMINRLAAEAMVLNGLTEAEVELQKNA